MSSKERAGKGMGTLRSSRPKKPQPSHLMEGTRPEPGFQRAGPDPRSLTPQGVVQLQRMAGNRAVNGLLSGATRRQPVNRAGLPVQAKLMVGPAGDEYEQEADRIAEQAMRMPQGATEARPTKSRIQRMGYGGFKADKSFEQRLGSSQGNGQALEPALRHRFESSLGADFSRVRLHTGSESAGLARQIQAKAFTHGSDIHFGRGQYDPHSTAGQTLLAHELTHVVQQGAAGQPRIQRKVGFELESADWLAWKYTGAGTPTREGAGQQGVAVRPAARQVEPLHVDPDYELQADDTPGPQASNIEFRTEPFEVEVNELARLEGAFNRIEGNVAVLERFADRKAEAEAEKDRYIFPAEHQLNQPGFLVSSAGDGKTQFKMQATAGIRLSDVPQMMQYLSRSAPEESELETQHRAPARAIMGSNPRQDRSLGQAPIWAQRVLREISAAYMRQQMQAVHQQGRNPLGAHRGAGGPANPFEANTENLIGFLSIAMAYLNNLANKPGEELKYWQPFMARNDFATMYGAVDAAQRQVLQANPMLLVDAVVAVLRQVAGVEGITANTPVANRAYTREENPDQSATNKYIKHDVMQDVTILRWLGLIARGGQDIMSHGQIAGFLRWQARQQGEATDTGAFRDKVEHHEDYLESVGINDPDASSTGEQLFLFENRGIINALERGEKLVDLRLARALARSYLVFYHKVEKERGGSFGQFPRY